MARGVRRDTVGAAVADLGRAVARVAAALAESLLARPGREPETGPDPAPEGWDAPSAARRTGAPEVPVRLGPPAAWLAYVEAHDPVWMRGSTDSPSGRAEDPTHPSEAAVTRGDALDAGRHVAAHPRSRRSDPAAPASASPHGPRLGADREATAPARRCRMPRATPGSPTSARHVPGDGLAPRPGRHATAPTAADAADEMGADRPGTAALGRPPGVPRARAADGSDRSADRAHLVKVESARPVPRPERASGRPGPQAPAAMWSAAGPDAGATAEPGTAPVADSDDGHRSRPRPGHRAPERGKPEPEATPPPHAWGAAASRSSSRSSATARSGALPGTAEVAAQTLLPAAAPWPRPRSTAPARGDWPDLPGERVDGRTESGRAGGSTEDRWPSLPTPEGGDDATTVRPWQPRSAGAAPDPESDPLVAAQRRR